MTAKRELLKVINRTPESLPVDDEVEAAPFLEPTNGHAPEPEPIRWQPMPLEVPWSISA